LSRKLLFALFAAGMVLALIAAWLETVPGYMDAEYYYGGALRLVDGKGWTENVLWNYLDDPSGLPHPAHVYWMPLASFLAVPGMLLFNSRQFFAARLFMIVLAGLITPLTAWISFRLFKNQKYAILSGFLALFPGFYLIYSTDVETYTPYLLLGGLFFYIGFRHETNLTRGDVFLLGILCGLMHLARADGILWLFGAGMLLVWRTALKKDGKESQFSWIAVRGLLLVLGYGAMMSPWYLRNMMQFASLFPPGTSRALWLTDYNQVFIYPADQLTFKTWLESGWQAILQVRFTAMIENIKNMIGVQGEVFLLPFIVAGAYRLRQQHVVIFGMSMWALTFIVMSFVFPLAGSRGGFFHSGSALQIFFWMLAPVGLDGFVRWGGRVRKWQRDDSWKVFASGLVVIAAVMTGVIFWQNVIGQDFQYPAWAAGTRQAVQIEHLLKDLKINPDETIMINNAPGYFTATGRSAIVTPDGDPGTSLEAGRRYQVKYLVLEKAHVDGLDSLYQSPQSLSSFVLLGQVNDAYLFRMTP
jgi:hypothetical protein